MSEKTVSNLVIRMILDSTEEIMGTNGLKAMLNYAGLIGIFENKPDYSLEKNFTDHEYGRLTSNWYQILGNSGAKALFRIMGKSSGKRAIATGVFDSFKDLDPTERIYKMIELFILATGRGEASREGSVIFLDNPRCTACAGIKSTSAICTAMNGAFDEFAAWAGVTGARTVETMCKAKGDDTCRYEVLLT
jgi:predicted hydrocarbon binding protein